MDLDGNSLSLEAFIRIVEKGEGVRLSESAVKKIQKSRAVVDKAITSGDKFYSINTGFGILSKVFIPSEKLDELQENIIRSHCSGVGEIHSEIESRAMLLLRTNVLAKGYSGVRLELVELLVEMLNKRVHPLIPTKGSVGASGDLAPLAHLASVIIGEGEAHFEGKRLSGKEALVRAHLKPIKLAPKEGLSLINGTQQMTAMAALLLVKSEELSDLADLICSSSLEGILGSPRAFTPWVHQTRAFRGQRKSADRLRAFMAESEIYQSHVHCERIQDPYSFRCAPQVHGAVRDLFSFVRSTVEVELNASTDNPLVNGESGEIISNGNFHGQPIAFALDILGMGLSELSSISERRISKLIDPVFSELPTFLAKDPGLNSGFMAAQYTAASLVSENKLLTHPASTDSIPTNNEKEDHVSMGPIAARKAKTILENTCYVLAIESLVACQALDFRRPLKPGRGPSFLFDRIRKIVPRLERDRYLHHDIESVASLIKSGSLYSALCSTLPTMGD